MSDPAQSAESVRGKCRLYGGTPPCPDADESCRTACAQIAESATPFDDAVRAEVDRLYPSLRAELSAEYVSYCHRAEELIEAVHLNANEALIARLLAGIADWFVETHASDVWGRAVWNVFADWASPVTDLKALIDNGFDVNLAGRSALQIDGSESGD